MSLLTAGVMRGMLGASFNMKIADVSIGVYKIAKGKGEEDTMQRAMGYATDSMSNANENNETVQECLLEAQTEAKEQKKAEQQEINQHTTPAGTVEISDQGRLAAGEIAVAPDSSSQTNTTITEQSVNNTVTVAETYTPKGSIKSVSIGTKLSVSI